MKVGDLCICKKNFSHGDDQWHKGMTALVTQLCPTIQHHPEYIIWVSHVWVLYGEEKRWLGVNSMEMDNNLLELISGAKEE